MNKEVELNDIIDIIIEKLESGGTVTFTPSGTSMLPMLRDGQDIVVLSRPPEKNLNLFDLPLYKRSDGSYVLHRVVDFDRDGSYVMRGDNQFHREHGVKHSDIIAVVISFYRKGKIYKTSSLRYKLYVYFWQYTSVFRHAYRSGKRRTKKLLGIEE